MQLTRIMKILSLLAEKKIFELENSEKTDFLASNTDSDLCATQSADSGSLHKGYYLHNL